MRSFLLFLLIVVPALSFVIGVNYFSGNNAILLALALAIGALFVVFSFSPFLWCLKKLLDGQDEQDAKDMSKIVALLQEIRDSSKTPKD